MKRTAHYTHPGFPGVELPRRGSTSKAKESEMAGMGSFNWECPHCDRAQTVTSESSHLMETRILAGDIIEGWVAAVVTAIGCVNRSCKRLTVTTAVRPMVSDGRGNLRVDYDAPALGFVRLIPESHAKVQPEHIPEPLREDYYEACKIRDLSPKAAATLARRCLQGMIRDFAGISERTLNLEIKKLREQVDASSAAPGVTIETVDAIDHVRKVGNVGAHMEADINVIVPVEPGEAQMLIELIEMLFDEWYTARHKRAKRLAELAILAAEKQQLITEAAGAPQP